MKSRKSKEHEKEAKKKQVVIKLFFLSILILLILITDMIISYRNKQKKQDEQNGQKKVVEEKKYDTQKAQENINERVKGVMKQAEEARVQGEATYRELYEKGVSEAERKAAELIYNTTLKPFIDKFENLPEDQQEFIQQEICKPEPTEVSQGGG